MASSQNDHLSDEVDDNEPLTIGGYSRSRSSSNSSVITVVHLPQGQLPLTALNALPPIEVPTSFEHPNLGAFTFNETGSTPAKPRTARRYQHKRSGTQSAKAQTLDEQLKETNEQIAILKVLQGHEEQRAADTETDRALNAGPLAMSNNNFTQNFLGESGPSIPNNLNHLQRSTSSSGHSAHGPQQQMNGTSQAGMSALNAVPTNAGYSMDLSFVLEKINELSQQLQINRAQSSDIVAKVQEIRRRATADHSDLSIQQVNGQLNGNLEPQAVFVLRRENRHLLHELHKTTELLVQHQNAITNVTEQVRNHVYGCTMEKIDISKYYHGQLTAEREAALFERLENERMREGLRGCNVHLRKAIEINSTADCRWIKKLAYYKHECRALRKIVFAESYRQGVDPCADDPISDDEYSYGDEGIGGMSDDKKEDDKGGEKKSD